MRPLARRDREHTMKRRGGDASSLASSSCVQKESAVDFSRFFLQNGAFNHHCTKQGSPNSDHIFREIHCAKYKEPLYQPRCCPSLPDFGQLIIRNHHHHLWLHIVCTFRVRNHVFDHKSRARGGAKVSSPMPC